jgi:hypothetical protein
MPRIKIKSLEDRVACSGIFFGGPPTRPKLHPGEVVDMPEDDPILKSILDTGKVELTLDPVTRPLDYESKREAQLCSPVFKPRDDSEAEEARQARAAVAARLDAEAEQKPKKESKPKASPAAAATPNPRAERRRKRERVTGGEAATA